MTKNVVSVQGSSYNGLVKVLREWIDLYQDDLPSDSKLEIFRNGHGNYIVRVDPRVNNERFIYLVNYLRYPEGSSLGIVAEGFTIADDSNLFPNELLGKEVLVFVPNDDTEYDNVRVVGSSNQVYKIDFGGDVSREDTVKVYQPLVIGELPSIDIIAAKPKKKRANFEDEAKKTRRRFFLFSAIVVGLVMLSFLAFLSGRSDYFACNLAIGVAVAGWFLADYVMLQSNEFYLYSLALSLCLLAVGLFIQYHFPEDDLKLANLGSLSPICLLVVQRPSRYLFKEILGREPIVDRPPPSFWDFVYSAVLFVSMILLPLGLGI